MNDAELALMAKIRLLYERSGTGNSFLAFNVGLPLTEDDLDFVGGSRDGTGGDELDRLQKMADFAAVVDQVPAVDAVWTPENRSLTDVYASIFQLGEVADIEYEPGDEARVEAARAVLFEKREVPDLITGASTVQQVPTPEYEQYREHERAYFEALEQLNAARLTLEHAAASETTGTDESEEPSIEELQQRRTDAWNAWIEQGYKREIERAQLDIQRLGPRGPGLLWQAWETAFESTTPENSPETNQFFYPTGYTPTGFIQSDEWTNVTLDESEIDSLVSRVREETPELLESELVQADVQTDLEIERLSVELARVELARNWFEPELLQSRIWKWRFDREPLSDGGDPPRGIMPAYTVSMIFARNLEITLKPDSKRNEEAIKNSQEGKPLVFGPMLLNQVTSTAKAGTVQTLKTATFDPKETLAIREINRKLGTAQVSTRKPIELKTKNADVVATSPRVASLASVMAMSAASSKAKQRRQRPKPTSTTSRPLTTSSRVVTPTVKIRPQQPVRIANRVALTRPFTINPATTVRPRPRPRPSTGTATPRPRPRPRPSTGTGPPRPRPKRSGYQGTVRERLPDGTVGTGIDEVQVTFESKDGSVHKSVQTDERGAYRVELLAGDYVVTARKYGYDEFTTAPGVFTCRGDGFQTGTIRLKRTTEIETWESVQLVAFVCRKLPKSPNPAPGLTWT